MENTKVDYKSENGGYWKVLLGLLILTAITFIQPGLFLENYTFAAQMLVGTVKAWLILMYYMHLKGETLIITFMYFSLFIVLVFFVIVIGVDVINFQFMDASHITSGDTAAAVSESHGAAHAEHAHH